MGRRGKTTFQTALSIWLLVNSSGQRLQGKRAIGKNGARDLQIISVSSLLVEFQSSALDSALEAAETALLKPVAPNLNFPQ